MSEFDAYLAGLFEGEGCIYANDKRITLTVVMTDEEIIHKFHKLSGCGVVYGPYLRKNPNANPSWTWRVTKTDDVLSLFARMLPYLGERRINKFNECLSTYNNRPRKTVCVSCGGPVNEQTEGCGTCYRRLRKRRITHALNQRPEDSIVPTTQLP